MYKLELSCMNIIYSKSLNYNHYGTFCAKFFQIRFMVLNINGLTKYKILLSIGDQWPIYFTNIHIC